MMSNSTAPSFNQVTTGSSNPPLRTFMSLNFIAGMWRAALFTVAKEEATGYLSCDGWVWGVSHCRTHHCNCPGVSYLPDEARSSMKRESWLGKMPPLGWPRGETGSILFLSSSWCGRVPPLGLRWYAKGGWASAWERQCAVSLHGLCLSSSQQQIWPWNVKQTNHFFLQAALGHGLYITVNQCSNLRGGGIPTKANTRPVLMW